MAKKIGINDLLPREFDDLYAASTGWRIRQKQRKELLRAIARSLQIANLVQNGRRSPRSPRTNNPRVLVTSNEFEIPGLGKTDIIHRMSDSTGISFEFCSLALAIIEANTFVFLSESAQAEIFIAEIGEIRLAPQTMPEPADIKRSIIQIEALFKDLGKDVELIRDGKSAVALFDGSVKFLKKLGLKFKNLTPANLRSFERAKANAETEVTPNQRVSYIIEFPGQFLQNRDEVPIVDLDGLEVKSARQ